MPRNSTSPNFSRNKPRSKCVERIELSSRAAKGKFPTVRDFFSLAQSFFKGTMTTLGWPKPEALEVSAVHNASSKR
jgi:hypothetical protein